MASQLSSTALLRHLSFYILLTWFPVLRVAGNSAQSSVDAGSVKVLEYSISEELPTDTFVGNVKSDSDLSRRYDEHQLRLLHFHFRHVAGQSHASRKMFSVNESTGEIRTKQIIDRDTLCDVERSECDVTFEVTVRPTAYFQIIRVVVHINDVNDNAPTFPQEHVTLFVIETTPVGTQFLIPSADDADSGDFAVQGYQLWSISGDEEIKEGPFELQVIDQVSGFYNVNSNFS